MIHYCLGQSNSSFKNDTTGINQRLIKSVYEKYGIKIYYGTDYIKETSSVNATPFMNIENANKNLKAIEILLKKYPRDFFKNFNISENKKYSVVFYLVENFSNDNIALAVKDNTSEYKLFISNYDDLERAVHHEIYHLIEYFMEEKSGKGTLYTNWEKLNPIDYEYAYNVDNITTRYVYNNTLKNKGAFFITNYSKYSGKEDRAEIFADMMTQNIKPIYYSNDEPIRKKAQTISDEIKNILVDFDLKNVYWNRLLK